MKIVDLNVLIYAVNKDAPNHKKAHNWWETSLSQTETVGLPWVVLLGFLRITTNPNIIPSPLTPEQACELINDWLTQPPVQIVIPTDRHWSILKQLLISLGTASNLTTDAHMAALAIEKGATLYSFDTDFARFPNLKWSNLQLGFLSGIRYEPMEIPSDVKRAFRQTQGKLWDLVTDVDQ